MMAPQQIRVAYHSTMNRYLQNFLLAGVFSILNENTVGGKRNVKS
jgi:hypothetical protein